ncbi:hypothetical protein [Rhodococcus sp. BP22]|uniref:hypothetical protein n=1 Tax=Rhodococcus sp. BP22 TaxID=2758566 RepID=UPI0021BDEFA5|nr:hypothetical protein [Rhodococcus sp. BP22]
MRSRCLDLAFTADGRATTTEENAMEWYVSIWNSETKRIVTRGGEAHDRETAIVQLVAMGVRSRTPRTAR